MGNKDFEDPQLNPAEPFVNWSEEEWKRYYEILAEEEQKIREAEQFENRNQYLKDFYDFG